MRLQYALVTFLCALSCAERIGARQGLRIRQDSTSDVTTTTDRPQSSTASNDETSSSPTPTSTQSKDDEAKTTSSAEHSADATSPITPTGTATDLPTSTVSPLPGSNSTTDGNVLPLQPKLNAPVGVAGALLMISGLALGFVGVRNRSVQTFLSTALLMALGCEVLIFYLMHPPVPEAIQAAYLIAGVAGGLLLGGLSLIFKEVSEGFGCVLGGFCFAMWLLVLSPGGLITNKVGKIILIAILCALGYATYISRFTRVYGLVVCTSFAGATAFVLGIDCFCGSGLKEFWLYIWDLNDNEFPLFTDTYPITRNMRAEIAGIIIAAFFGTMSQIKIWNIVKEKKAKHDAQRIQDEEARVVLEEEVGRDVESRNRRSLAQWEEQYDDKKEPRVQVSDSGIGSSIEEYGKEGSGHYDLEGSSTRRQSYPLAQLRPATVEGEAQSSSKEKRHSGAPSIPAFDFDAESFEYSGEASRSTHGTQAGTPQTEPGTPGLNVPEPSVKDRRGVALKRLSLQSLAQKDALEAAGDGRSSFEEEDDIASSIAATAAEPPDVDALSMKLSRPNSMYLPQMPGGGVSPSHAKEQFIEEDDDEVIGLGGKSAAGGSSPRLSQTPGTPGEADPFDTAADGEDKAALADRLPKRISKAAANYRTNEWAKEVGRAEPEPLEEVDEHTVDAVQIEMGDAAESARANENNAAPAPPPPPPAPPAPPAPPKANQKERRRSSQHLSKTPSGAAAVPVYAHDRRKSNDSWAVPLAKRASSNPIQTIQPTQPTVDTHNVSAPILEQDLVQSPIDQQPQSPPKSRPASRMPSMPNLMDVRNDLMDRRVTTTSFMTLPNASAAGLPATTSEGSGQAQGSREGSQNDKTSLRSIPEPADPEDMTLAERKALVQRQSSMPLPSKPRHLSQQPQPEPQFIPHATTFAQANASAPRPPKPVRLSTGGTALYDSHQPQRTSTHNATKQAQNWSAWRSSNAIAQTSRTPYVVGDQQMDMLRAHRRQSEQDARAKEEREKKKQERIDAHMRMGGMNEAHRNILSKMQMEANRNNGVDWGGK
ncbi:hypothetical protein M409DRAFT_70758 [Zasmidium cellare ATCC 36951]|uniref:TM7S3/TM198-like domain-containing protein n=1 Tax=Zasmidium cellare ATCC 36951 TaxID=1080233 RepID=A0A6A6C0S0_ZASCE|nr:uncharacterized protein M409DRAFT_70758 [Zasmidium cellare ATCC 36951]KAF2159868.1 hypothetical protein M409DRAFT_70758 [Zasmidium cellare ATCC 36951]